MIATTVNPADLAADLRPRLAALTVLLRRASAEGGLTPSQLALLHALRDGTPRRVTELAELAGVSQPSMTVLVRRLEADALLRRTPDPTDRRAVHVSTTPAGQRALTEVVAARTRWLAERLATLDPADREAIASALPAFDRLAAVTS